MPADDPGPGVGGLVDRLAELTGNAIWHFVGTELVRRPYPELHGDVRTVRERLRRWGVGSGTRVGIWGENSYDWVVHELALLDLGCVTVTLPVAEFAAETPPALAERYDLELLLASPRHCSEAPGWLAPLTLDGAPASAMKLRPAPPPLGPDVFTVVFSSGTTGSVKAIQIGRRATDHCLAEFGRQYEFRPDDAILVGLPLSTFQQRIMLYCAIWYGFDAIVVEPSPLMFVALKQGRPTIMGGPPAFYEILENRFRSQPAVKRVAARTAAGLIRGLLPAGRRPAALRRLFRQAHEAYGGRMRLMLSGSAPLRRSTAELFTLVDLPLFQLYGLTESGFIAWNRPGDNRIGSVGRPVFPGSVTIAEDGEIMVRWPVPQSPGYLGEPPEVAAATYRPDGTVATGDLGRFDADGYLHVVGRKKDIIVTRTGHKIAPSPIEQEILADPDVAQAVLVGGDPYQVGAVVALRVHAGEDTPEKVRRRVEEVNRTLPSASRVQRVVFTRDAFTRENGLMTTTLKLNRAAVARRFAGALERGETWA